MKSRKAPALDTVDSYLDDLQRDAASARRARVKAARECVNEFAIFIGPRLNRGKPWKQEELHEIFQGLAERHPYLILMSHPESGKTTQIAVIRTVWELGNNPDLRFAFISYTSKSGGTAAKIAVAVKELIERSPEVAEVFPELIPGNKWEESIFTVRRPTMMKDPTVQVVGYKGVITGSRVDRVIADDVIVMANTMTPEERKKFRSWWATIIDRLAADGRMIMMCNAWHPNDYVHEEWKKTKEGTGIWHVATIPVEKNGVYSCSFWNAERMAKVKALLTPLQVARLYYCKARDDGESVFDEERVRHTFEVIGVEYDFVHSLRASDIAEWGAYVACGVDLAVTQGKKAHRSSFSVGMQWPEDDSRQIVWQQSGRYRAEQIADIVVDLDRRYNPVFVVENNAAQRWIRDVIELKIERDYYKAKADGGNPEPIAMPNIVGFTTSRNKAHEHFGVESLAAEIFHYRWALPWDTGTPECRASMKRLREAIEFYTRGSHTADELMSMWFLREGLRRGLRAGRPEDEGSDHSPQQVRIIGAD